MMFKELFDLSHLNDSIPFVGLSTRLKHWRIKHPRVVTDQGQSVPHPEMPDSFRAFFIDLFFGGMGREPKNTPPLCLPWSALLCGYPIRLGLLDQGKQIMIYTFLIAKNTRQKLSDLKRIRRKSVIAKSEAEARKALSGLPLVFISCQPIKGAK